MARIVLKMIMINKYNAFVLSAPSWENYFHLEYFLISFRLITIEAKSSLMSLKYNCDVSSMFRHAFLKGIKFMNLMASSVYLNH